MAKSAYGIMITQDCNVYEKSIDTKRQQVQNVVRQAEKYLREARLEDYRAHNTQDVNECLDKVRTAIQADTACGANYKYCLDYTGAYIKTSGEPYFSPRFFQLADLIKLDGASSDTDVLTQNSRFNTFLESRKKFAEAALDTCRDKADWVWEEFKRAALIEIAQAQDDKIEEVKASCVDTMKECYDTQSQSLKNFDDTTAVAAGAIGAAAARQMCQDQVIACASLYGNTDGCTFDGNGRLTSGTNNGDRCGLNALLSFVDTVDNVRVAEGCDTALTNFAKELCTPSDGELGYPWRCRDLTKERVQEQILTRAALYCVNPDGTKYDTTKYTTNTANLNDQVTQKIKRLIEDIESGVRRQLMTQCEELNGLWDEGSSNQTAYSSFYDKFFGGTTTDKTERGTCIENSVRNACLTQDDITGGNGYAKYNATTDTCVFTNEWYEYQCKNMLDGDWIDNVCYWDAE